MKIRFTKNSYGRPVRIWIYLLTLGASLVWISMQGGALPYMFFDLVVLLLPFSALITVLTYRSLRIYQDMEPRKILRGKNGVYHLQLENVGLLPINDLVLETNLILAQIEGISDLETYTLMPGEKISLERSILCRYAGTYPVGACRIRITDCFSILTYEFPIPEQLRAIVSPRITHSAWSRVDRDNIRFSSRIRTQTLEEPVAGNEVRSYVPGDPISRIHWKSAAAHGELYTRLPEPQTMPQVLVILKSVPRIQTEEEIIKRDRFLEFAVSAVDYFVERRKAVRVLYPRGKIQAALVGDYRAFQKFYDDLSEGLFYDREMDEQSLEREQKNLTGTTRGLVMTVEEEAFPNGQILVIQQNI